MAVGSGSVNSRSLQFNGAVLNGMGFVPTAYPGVAALTGIGSLGSIAFAELSAGTWFNSQTSQFDAWLEWRARATCEGVGTLQADSVGVLAVSMLFTGQGSLIADEPGALFAGIGRMECNAVSFNLHLVPHSLGAVMNAHSAANAITPHSAGNQLSRHAA